MPRETTVADLILVLQAKDQAAKVEYVICKTDGEFVAVNVEKQAQPLIKMLKLFKG